MIVLQQVDDRYFSEISGYLQYDFDFAVFKQGTTEVYASSYNTDRWCRSQNCEVNLEAGHYVVHVSTTRLRRSELTIGIPQVRVDTNMAKASDYMETSVPGWDKRVLKRIRAQQAEAYSKASSEFSSIFVLEKHPAHYQCRLQC